MCGAADNRAALMSPTLALPRQTWEGTGSLAAAGEFNLMVPLPLDSMLRRSARVGIEEGGVLTT
jgi:hypothetical protein